MTGGEFLTEEGARKLNGFRFLITGHQFLMKKKQINQYEQAASNSMKHFKGQYLLCPTKLLS